MTSLYRIYDAAGGLLYVGVSASAIARMIEHSQKPWADQIARIEVAHYEDKATALRFEREAIRAEQPIHNMRSAVPNRRKQKGHRTEPVMLMTRIDLDRANAFTALAASRHRTVAAELRRMIDAELDHAADEQREAA